MAVLAIVGLLDPSKGGRSRLGLAEIHAERQPGTPYRHAPGATSGCAGTLARATLTATLSATAAIASGP
jgi:hypothetical protein